MSTSAITFAYCANYITSTYLSAIVDYGIAQINDIFTARSLLI